MAISLVSNYEMRLSGIGEVTWGMSLSDIRTKIDSAVPDNAQITKITLNFSGKSYNNNIFGALNEYVHCALTNSDSEAASNNEGGSGNCTNLFKYGPYEIKGRSTTTLPNQSVDITKYFGAFTPHNVQNTSYSRLTVAFTSKAVYNKDETFSLSLDVTYEIPNYTATFKNYDGTVLETVTVARGSTPSYKGSTPTRPQDAQYTYEFSGWSPAVGAITANTIYTAQYKATLRKYTVVWKNADGTVLETDTTEYGKMPTYDGATPIKPDTLQYAYTFAGWHIEVSEVKGNIEYIATYTQTTKTYTVTWKNADGTVLETDEKVPFGAMPEYNGATPTIPPTAQFTFEFATWDTAVTEVTKDVVYTAIYNKTVNKYLVEIINANENFGSIIGAETGEYEYGTQLTLTASPKNGCMVMWRNLIPDDYWEGDIIPDTTDNPITITVERDTTIIALFFAKGGIQIGTSYVNELYYDEQTQTVYFVIDEEIEIEPTGADTVDGLHLVATIYDNLPDGVRQITGVQVGTSYVYTI